MVWLGRTLRRSERSGICSLPERYLPVSEGDWFSSSGDAVKNEVAASFARSRSEIHHAVGSADDLGVVLHDQDGVLVVTESFQDVHESRRIARMKSDGRLIQRRKAC